MFNSCIVLDLDETLFHSETSVAPNEKLKKIVTKVLNTWMCIITYFIGHT